jgi:DNA mismatch repair protein MLH3
VPAPASHSLDCRDHGTKVSVRDLFGNMPVRVKQRYSNNKNRSEQERLWESLKQSVVALLVASGRVVALRMRDLGTSKSLTVSAPKARKVLEIGLGPPEKLRLALSTLQQAGSVSLGNLKSWVPASASSRSIVIRGGICLEPAPSKSTQFLSLGISPLSRSGHNELYDHVNRLFSRSRFGMIEQELLTGEEKLRRQRDRRFKQDGLTNKQLLTEKGVDRWPMFVLSISFKDDRPRSSSQTLNEEGKLASVINVLEALVTGWLASNHFRPQKRKAKELDVLSESESQTTASQKLPNKNDLGSSNGEQVLTYREKRPTSRQRLSSPTRPYTGVSSMNELSRIKSSNRSLLEQARPYTPGSRRPLTASAVELSTNRSLHNQQNEHTKSGHDTLASISQLSRNDLQLGVTANNRTPAHESERMGEERPDLPQDEVEDWTDPITKQTHQINSRTGATIAPEPRRGIADDSGTTIQDRDSQNIFARSIRLPARTQPVNKPNKSGGWLEGVLQNWQNPVFRCAEKSIQQASLHVPGEETGAISTGKFNFITAGQIDQAFKEVSHLNTSKITKTALKNAKVISQVDEKFILVALETGRSETDSTDVERTMLVVIDQHAADERVKVEQLLQDLSEPLSETDTVYTSTLGHKSRIRTLLLAKPITFRLSAREIGLLETHAGRFADWGILYDLPPRSRDTKEQDDSDLVARCLPPVITERCKLNPKLLITLLRTELWKLVEESSSTLSVTRQDSHSTDAVAGHDWLKAIGSFPQGLLDMVNSRACRSAIMFNDALSKNDCERLVADLAKCKFPFLCAHGRPSMVPLIDLGILGDFGREKGIGAENGETAFGSVDQDGDFVGAFGRWRDGMSKE